MRRLLTICGTVTILLLSLQEGYAYNTSDLKRFKSTGQCPNCDFQGAVIGGAYLHNIGAHGVNLQGADLQDANRQDAYLRYANLQGANLWGASLRRTDLGDAFFRGADFQETKLDNNGLEKTESAGAVWSDENEKDALVTVPLGLPAEKPVDEYGGIANTFPTTSVNVRFRSSASHPDDIAVIVGNAEYKKQGKDIPNVTPAYADAEGIKRYFKDALGVKEGNIIHLKDATGSQLVFVFGNSGNHKDKLFNWIKPGQSKVYVYYAGHGAPAGDEGSAYMIPSDSTVDSIELTGYPLATLYKNLGKIGAKSVTVILEACFSGTGQGGTLIKNASPVYLKAKTPKIPSNLTVISAGTATQIASWEKDKAHSLFTKYFLKGMSGEADVEPYGNGDGKVNYTELGKYLDGTMTYFARRYYGRDQKAQIVNREL